MTLNNSADGRWLTPDPTGGDVANPQSLNRYAYSLNNAATFNDPLGLQQCTPGQACPPPHPPACTNMDCADQYYHGEIPSICAIPGVDCGTFPWDEFGLMNIPVVTESFMPPQLLSTINFEAFGNANGYATSVSLFAPGGFTKIYASDAFTMFGGEFSPAAQEQLSRPTAVLQSQKPSILQRAKNWGIWYFCGNSPQGAVQNWFEVGAVKGAITGAITGGVTGTIFGEGIGAPFGAVLGGIAGFTTGATGGLSGGFAAAGVCSVAGVYKH